MNAYVSFLVALILFLPSTALIPNPAYFVLGIVCLLLYRRRLLESVNRQLVAVAILVSALISLLSFFADQGNLKFYGNFIPIQVGLLCSLFCSLAIDNKVAKFLIFLILFEILVGVTQYVVGVPTYFSFVNTTGIGISEGNLLYNKRVFGLSTNSSVLSGKAMVMLCLYYGFFSKGNFVREAKLIHLAVLIALMITFSRTGIVAYLMLVGLLVLKVIWSSKGPFVVFVILSSIIMAVLFLDFSLLVEQFTRGRGTVEVSGRDLIWAEYIEYIKRQAFFGNYGLKHYLYIEPYGLMHAHNSIIMTTYVLGLVPLMLIILPLMAMVLLNIRLVYVLTPLVLFSMAQYYLLWGASFADVILFALIFNSSSKLKENSCSTPH